MKQGELRPHDFRRTAARAFTRAGVGVGEQIVTKITGYKTRTVFDRCNICRRSENSPSADYGYLDSCRSKRTTCSTIHSVAKPAASAARAVSHKGG